jgi:fructose-1,6-bisphosphatase I/sedoheptulose-1,7-bisphosphatase
VAAGELAASQTMSLAGPRDETLPEMAERIFLRLVQSSGRLGGMLSPSGYHPVPLQDGEASKYLFAFDALESSPNLALNSPAGSVFSILRAEAGSGPQPENFLVSGREQVCAGYAIYGPSTLLVLSVGRGTHGFTLDPILGEFVLTHPDMSIADSTTDFSINAVNHRFWEPAIRRYVDECVAGDSGPRGRDFSMRWVDSMVAETHNILLRGGVFLNPMDDAETPRSRQARLIYAANPIAMLVEQAGGRASTGYGAVLDIQPRDLHQSVGLIFGTADEVVLIDDYHENTQDEYNAPLFGVRGLFRD